MEILKEGEESCFKATPAQLALAGVLGVPHGSGEGGWAWLLGSRSHP